MSGSVLLAARRKRQESALIDGMMEDAEDQLSVTSNARISAPTLNHVDASGLEVNAQLEAPIQASQQRNQPRSQQRSQLRQLDMNLETTKLIATSL